MAGINLFVDDLRDPASFKPGEDWHWAKTVTEAIRILATQHVARVSLDHDICHSVPVRPFKELGGLPFPLGTVPDDQMADAQRVYESGLHFPIACPETFEPVARYIALMKRVHAWVAVDNPVPQVEIHTANPIGRATMMKILAGGLS